MSFHVRRNLTICVSFHKEGDLANKCLKSIIRSVRASDTSPDVILGLDGDDEGTLRVLEAAVDEFERCELLRVDYRDPALTRKAMLQHSRPGYLAFIDGDDLISGNYIEEHLRVAKEGSLIRPEFIVSFGEVVHFHSQLDERTYRADKSLLLEVNPWASPVFGSTELLASIPFTHVGSPGFGYEDWLWNCEAKAAGIDNIVATNATYFYRKKKEQSRNQGAGSSNACLPKSRLFDP